MKNKPRCTSSCALLTFDLSYALTHPLSLFLSVSRSNFFTLSLSLCVFRSMVRVYGNNRKFIVNILIICSTSNVKCKLININRFQNGLLRYNTDNGFCVMLRVCRSVCGACACGWVFVFVYVQHIREKCRIYNVNCTTIYL